jgi:chlorobactene glucosyltransferase
MNGSYEAFANHQAGTIWFLAALLLIAFSNLVALKRIDRLAARMVLPDGMAYPFVSILVPARNEEANIEGCARSLLIQDYPAFEVLVLDDHSQDRTGQILTNLADQYPRLRVLQGKPLPEGWLGKHWACHQLDQAARGQLLLFTDADTRHHPKTLVEVVKILLIKRLDLLTAWPQQEMKTRGERLLVPFIYWSLFNFLPLELAFQVRFPPLVTAIGQFMLFRRSAYDAVGGYSRIRGHAADDVALAREIKAHGFRWRLVDAGRRVSCRMYGGFKDAFDGFSKNLFAAFDYRLLPFAFVWSWIGVVFLEPPLVLAAYLLSWQIPARIVTLALVSATGALALWIITYTRFRFPTRYVLLYPLGVGIFVLIAFRSVYLSYIGKAVWKDRNLPRPTLKWW